MTFYLGLDPDLHTTAIAILREGGEPMNLSIVTVDARLKEYDAEMAAIEQLAHEMPRLMMGCDPPARVAIESQESVYAAGQGSNPRDLMRLRSITGAAVALVRGCCSVEKTIITAPVPLQWKGNAPKQIHHRRTFEKLGWPCEAVGKPRTGYCRPTKEWRDDYAAHIPKGHWRHLSDAVGLAHWAMGKPDLREAEHGHEAVA